MSNLAKSQIVITLIAIEAMIVRSLLKYKIQNYLNFHIFIWHEFLYNFSLNILYKIRCVWHYKLQWNLSACFQSLDGSLKPLPFPKEPKISTFKNHLFDINILPWCRRASIRKLARCSNQALKIINVTKKDKIITYQHQECPHWHSLDQENLLYAGRQCAPKRSF